MQQAYLELKISWELFQKAPDALSTPERTRVSDVARRQRSIEQRILESSDAAQVVIPAATLLARIEEVRQRYPSDHEFLADLQRIGLDEGSLETAIERDLRVEAVLERVAASCAPVSTVDAEIYYRLHPEGFNRPEARRLRHILITFNTPKEKAKALDTLENLRASVVDREQFATAALRHSQCPTAMEGGLLGAVRRGQLYEALESTAFSMDEGDISPVLESPMGLHILYCDEILPYGLIPFSDVRERIIERLTDKRRQEAQRDWVKSLCRQTAVA